MDALDWKFEYPWREKSEKPIKWVIQDFTDSVKEFATKIQRPVETLEILHMILSKCDHMHIEKINGVYKLLLGADIITEPTSAYYRCIAENKRKIFAEFLHFNPENIIIYNCLWNNVKIESEQISFDNSNTLEELLKYTSLRESFLQDWTAFTLDLYPKSPYFEVVEEVVPYISYELSALIKEQESIEGMYDVATAGMEALFKMIQQVKNTVETMKRLRYVTLIIIKPPAVTDGRTKSILQSFSDAGYEVVQSKFVVPTLQQAEDHYSEHKGSPEFKQITTSLCFGEIFVAVLSGADNPNIINDVKKFVRGNDDVHASDSIKAFQREHKLWFP